MHLVLFTPQKPGGVESGRSMEAFESETHFNNDEDVEKERLDVHQYFAQGGSDRVVAVKQINKVYGSKVQPYVHFISVEVTRAFSSIGLRSDRAGLSLNFGIGLDGPWAFCLRASSESENRA